MKKAMKQSKLITILNGISIFALVLMAILLLVYANANNQLSEDNKARYDLTYNANRFMDGSTYLTEEVRAYAATGDKTAPACPWPPATPLRRRASPPCRR